MTRSRFRTLIIGLVAAISLLAILSAPSVLAADPPDENLALKVEIEKLKAENVALASALERIIFFEMLSNLPEEVFIPVKGQPQKIIIHVVPQKEVQIRFYPEPCDWVSSECDFELINTFDVASPYDYGYLTGRRPYFCGPCE